MTPPLFLHKLRFLAPKVNQVVRSICSIPVGSGQQLNPSTSFSLIPSFSKTFLEEASKKGNLAGITHPKNKS